MTNEVEQTENLVLGNQAGRDNHITTINSLPKSTSLGKLLKRLKEETIHDPSLIKHIEELKIFTRKKSETKEVRGLENKLKAAGRVDQLDMARQTKEIVYKHLKKNQFSPTFQIVYASLLGRIFENFDTYVKPAINAGGIREEIDQLVLEKVVQPIVTELENCGEVCEITPQEIKGMVYFLTGNCHIKWN